MRVLKTVIILAAISSLLTACAKNPEGAETSAETGKKSPVASSGQASPSSSLLPQPGTNGALGQTQSAPTPGMQSSAANSSSSTDLDETAHLFIQMGCTACHGAKGKGVMKSAPDFTDKAWNAKQTDEKMFSTIKNGHTPMPPYGGRLTDDQIKSLVAHVRSFAM